MTELSSFPDKPLVRIISFLDPRSFYRFMSVSRKLLDKLHKLELIYLIHVYRFCQSRPHLTFKSTNICTNLKLNPHPCDICIKPWLFRHIEAWKSQNCSGSFKVTFEPVEGTGKTRMVLRKQPEGGPVEFIILRAMELIIAAKTEHASKIMKAITTANAAIYIVGEPTTDVSQRTGTWPAVGIAFLKKPHKGTQRMTARFSSAAKFTVITLRPGTKPKDVPLPTVHTQIRALLDPFLDIDVLALAKK